jgi:methionyl-tRNA synthetase
MARSPENSDSSFTWEDLQSVVQSDLNNSLGNLVSRVVKITGSKFDGEVPEAGELTELEINYLNALKEEVANYSQNLEELSFRKAIESLKKIWSLGNQYIGDAAPWSEIKTDPKRAGEQINYALNYIATIAKLSEPVIPHTTQNIYDVLGIKNEPEWYVDFDNFHVLESGAKVSLPEPLFKKIDDAEIEELKSRYSGEQNTVERITPNTPAP